MLVALGNAQRRRGETTHAIATYRRAIQLDPGCAVAHYSLGNACAAAGALGDAALAFEAALAVRPGYPEALDGLGNVRLLQRRFADALRCFAKLDPARTAYGRGVALQGMGDEPAAAAAFREALRRDPAHLPALNNLCVALLRSGAPEAALAACDRYLALAPVNRKALAYRAAALIELGRRDAARELLDYDRLLVERDLALPNAAFVAAIERHPSLRFEPAGKSTRGGSQTGELVDAAGAFTALDAALREAIDAYFAHVRDHCYAARLPARWRLATWAVVLDDGGHQSPHFHPEGYVSGVYYVAVPRVPAPQGHLELGDTRDALGGTGEPLLHRVAPRHGLLVMFPSYFYHRTIPFAAAGKRISIAFDCVPS
jgi:tetratricopeptide (TPR) repeat protein